MPGRTACGAAGGLCFARSTSEHRYDLCLFKSATQKPAARAGIFSEGGEYTQLGTRWVWRKRARGGPIVGVLSGGALCAAARVDRSLVVTFACAAEREELGKVSEASTCVYEVTLHTPAACE